MSIHNALLSRSNTVATPPSAASRGSDSAQSTPGLQPNIPSIRLVSAKPTAAGMASDASPASKYPFDAQGASASASTSTSTRPSVLAPKPGTNSNGTKRRIVPKKSRLSILNVVGSKASSTSGAASSISKVGVDKENVTKANDSSVRYIGTGSVKPVGSTGGKGFEIYVDPTDDPDIGEIVVVKRQKPRAGLNGMNWGTLGEVTNVPSASQQEKEQDNENQTQGTKTKDGDSKWWSLGRGRKISKEKEKGKDKENKTQEKGSLRAKGAGSVRSILSLGRSKQEKQEMPARSQTPDPFKVNQDPRTRFNSLGPGVSLQSSFNQYASVSSMTGQRLNAIIEPEGESVEDTPRASRTRAFTLPESPTPMRPTSRASTNYTDDASNQGSIAIRAMRSVRSLARMASWAQLKNGDDDEDDEKQKEKERKKEKKEKEKDKGKQGTIRRASTISMASLASTADSATGSIKDSQHSLGKKRSILGLGIGLPSSIRKSSLRGSSSGATSLMNIFSNPTSSNSSSARPRTAPSLTAAVPPSIMANPPRRSLDLPGAHATAGRYRSGSVMSNASSLRPMSTASFGSDTRASSGSASTCSHSGASVKWDEEGLENVREQRRRERADRRAQAQAQAVQEESEEESKKGKKGKKAKEKEKEKGSGGKESKKSSDARRRTGIADIFPEADITGARNARTSTSSSSSSSSSGQDDTVKLDVQDGKHLQVEAVNAGHQNDEESGAEESDSEKTQTLGRVAQEATTPTPPKSAIRLRPRPVSDQVFGRVRPVAMYEDDAGTLTKLEGATNDLAQLINVLDLEATPASPDFTPKRPSPISFEQFIASEINAKEVFRPAESPLKARQSLDKERTASNESLRPYAQRLSNSQNGSSSSSHEPKTRSITAKKSTADLFGPIAPWSTLMKDVSSPVTNSPLKRAASTIGISPRGDGTPLSAKHSRKHSSTPAPEPDPTPVFQPLKPRASGALNFKVVPKSPRTSSLATPDSPTPSSRSRSGSTATNATAQPLKFSGPPSRDGTIRGISTLIFGPRSQSSSRSGSGSGLVDETEAEPISLSTVFRRLDDTKPLASNPGTMRKKATPPAGNGTFYDSDASLSRSRTSNIPIPPEARRKLGMNGTMGGSSTSAYRQALDDSDPDSDVPEELKVILKEGTNRLNTQNKTRNRVSMLPSPGRPPVLPLPEPSSLASRSTTPIPEQRPSSVELPSFKFTDEDGMTNSEDDEDSQSGIVGSSFAMSTSVPSVQPHSDIISSYSGSGTDDEDYTKQSFDFTGELRKLNQSIGGSRDSFIEQLENAFKTPARVDLSYGFLSLGGGAPKSTGRRSQSEEISMSNVVLEVPPLPELPHGLKVMRGQKGSLSGPGIPGGTAEKKREKGIKKMKSVMAKLAETRSTIRLRSLSQDLSGIGENAENSIVSEEYNVDVKEDSHVGYDDDEEPLPQPSASSSRQRAASPAPSTVLDVKEPALYSLPNQGFVDEDSIELPRRLPTKPSEGQLNTGFKFGGLPQEKGEQLTFEFDRSPSSDRPLTLSDIIPPTSHVRAPSDPSTSSSLLGSDDSILQPIFARSSNASNSQRSAADEESDVLHPIPRIRLNSSSSDTSAREYARASFYSQSASPASFRGFDSFDEVRRGFEFNANNSWFYPATTSSNRRSVIEHNHYARRESWLSIASVSSYGRVVNAGMPDPFDYGLAVLRERPISEDMSVYSSSTTVDDTFDFVDRSALRRRQRVESDASSFYFNDAAQHPGPVPGPSSRPRSRPASIIRGHRYRDSNTSLVSLPPVSLYNRNFAHGQSSTSINQSINQPLGNNNRVRHRRDSSDSATSDFSARGLGRPGLGDKMFDMVDDRAGAPLTAIMASPRESQIDPSEMFSERFGESMRDEAEDEDSGEIIASSGSSMDGIVSGRLGHIGRVPSFDSILDDKRRGVSSMDMTDSLFDSKMSRDRSLDTTASSVFGCDASREDHARILPRTEFRPVSMFSMAIDQSPVKQDETMVSMIGGGHVRRRSVGSIIEESPCAQAGRSKKSQLGNHFHRGIPEPFLEVPPLQLIPIEKPAIVISPPTEVKTEKAVRPQPTVFDRPAAEESVLVAQGEDAAGLFRNAPVFSRPAPLARSRSSVCTTLSSGTETPPLLASDNSSCGGGSQSSIDIAQLNFMLTNPSLAANGFNRARARARGHGHRQRISQARASRSSIYSVYETIQEESFSATSSPIPPVPSSSPALHKMGTQSTPTIAQSVYVVDSDAGSVHSELSAWEDDTGVLRGLRNYYALKDEAHNAISESQAIWADTPLSVFSLQSFQPPRNPAVMREMLKYSVQNFGPLPSELRSRRLRTFSRPSPYQQARQSRGTPSPVKGIRPPSFSSNVLQPVSSNMNISGTSPQSSYELNDKSRVFSPPAEEPVFKKGVRPRLGSGARRTALALARRKNGTAGVPAVPLLPKSISSEEKENVAVGSIATSNTLRVSRPRPRGRVAPGAQQRPIRI